MVPVFYSVRKQAGSPLLICSLYLNSQPIFFIERILFYSATTSFLAKFAKQKVAKNKDIIVAEKEVALPHISHVLQISETEMEWYGKVNVSLKHKKRSVDVDFHGLRESQLVSSSSDWALLINAVKVCIF